MMRRIGNIEVRGIRQNITGGWKSCDPQKRENCVNHVAKQSGQGFKEKPGNCELGRFFTCVFSVPLRCRRDRLELFAMPDDIQVNHA